MRIFYYASIATDEINSIYGQDFLTGAAANKVLGVCAALAENGASPVIVSGLIPATGADLVRCVTFHRARRIAFAKVWSLGRGLVKRLTASLGLLAFTIRVVNARDRVIFYNFVPELIPTAAYLKFRGRPAVLDLEDGPRADDRSLRGFGYSLSFKLMFPLCADRIITVSHQLGRQMRVAAYLPVYGVAKPMSAGIEAAERFAGERVTILFGGSISRETGLDLYVAMLRHLARTDPDLPATFIVTGLYQKDEFEALRTEIQGCSRIELDLRSGLTAIDYAALAGRIDIGLNLRLPDRLMSQTTFPSKVIEYASLGMLLISTRSSDVPLIFEGDAAIFVDTVEPEELAARIAAAVRDRAGSAAIARRGTQAVAVLTSSREVGRRILDFLEG